MEIIDHSNKLSGEGECNCNCKHCKECKECENCKGKKVGGSDKWKYTLYTVIIAILVFNPYTYILVNKLINKFVKIMISDKAGCPSMLGFVVHMAVFTLVLRYMMDLKI